MTEMNSSVRQLGQVAQFINGGAWRQNEYSSYGVPVLQVSNIRGQQIDLTDCKYLPESSLEKYGRHLIRRDDLIIATVGSHPSQPNSVVGRPAIARSNAVNALLNQNAVIVRSTCDDVDQKWLGWLGRDQPFRDYITACARGSANQVRMAIGLLKQMPIHPPSLRTQRRVAEILGAYDDLIDINRRRVTILEEMARGLFKEWFTSLRFPGHKAVAIEDTTDGPLPEGWTYTSLANVANINAASLRPANAPAEIGYIDIASVSSGQINAINRMSFSDAPGRARRLVKNGSILWSNVRPNRRSFALVFDPTPDVIASTGFTVLDARETSFAYLYQWVTTDAFVGYLVGNAQGAAYPAVTSATFERAVVLLPPSDLVARYTAFAEPILRLADQLRKSNANLAAARDLLLPRLVSGSLSVALAELELEAA
jgi:type I restriction enzyme S subunit